MRYMNTAIVPLALLFSDCAARDQAAPFISPAQDTLRLHILNSLDGISRATGIIITSFIWAYGWKSPRVALMACILKMLRWS